MRVARQRLALAVLGLAAVAFLSACGKGHALSGGPAEKLAPVLRQGAITVTTRNTTRLGGPDAAADAAAVARAVYPALTSATRPRAVIVVASGDWPAALTSAVMAAAPNGWPILFAGRHKLSEVTQHTLAALHPTGAATLGGVQVVRVGTDAEIPKGLRTRTLKANPSASETAAELVKLLRSASGGTEPRQVIVAAAEAPRALLMPAAGLAAESGAPILFVEGNGVPSPTAAALAALHKPAIYVLASSTVPPKTIAALRRYGNVTTLSKGDATSEQATANAVSVARFTDGTFGWGVKDPGHGLVFANASRPLDAPAAALLSATAQYGPLMLIEKREVIPPALSSYLGDIQPAYASAPEFRPVRGVYNHGWLIGDERAIGSVTQAELDALLEITEREHGTEEAVSGQPEPGASSSTTTTGTSKTTTSTTPTATTPTTSTTSTTPPPAKTKTGDNASTTTKTSSPPKTSTGEKHTPEKKSETGKKK